MASKDGIRNILLENCTDKYFIEYDVYLSNHMSTGIIALNNLRVSEHRIKCFVDVYNKRLEKPQYGDHLDEQLDGPLITDDQAQRLLGKRKAYYNLLKYYRYRLTEWGSVDILIQKEFPKVSLGLIGSALHGLILTGYGINADNDQVICEGMAYLHHSYDPIRFQDSHIKDVSQFGKGNREILDVLKDVGNDDNLRQIMLDGAAKLAERGVEFDFCDRASVLMEVGEQLLVYANQIDVPIIKTSTSVNQEVVTELSNWILNQMIAVYTFSETRNDFFLLHAVTSSWAMKQIIPLLHDLDALLALRTLTCSLIAAYVVQDTPALNADYGKYPGISSAETWEKIIEETISQDFDEHIYKLVQISYECWCHLEDKNCTLAGLYISAARTALDHGFDY